MAPHAYILRDEPTLTLLSLNIRGLRRKTRHITDLIETHRPDFVLLQETNIHDKKLQQHMERQLRPMTKNIFWTTDRAKRPGKGVAILQTKNDWTVTRHTYDNNGRIGCLEISKDNKTYSLYNIYGPATNIDEEGTLDDLDDRLDKDGHDKILGGDFNMTLDILDSSNYRGRNTREKTKQLKSIMKDHTLSDAYRTLHPLGKQTTFTSNRRNRARLDRFITTQDITPTQVTHIHDTLLFTDHSAVLARFGTPTSKRTHNSSHWKFNNTLLDIDSFTHMIRSIIKDYTKDFDEDNTADWWDSLKSTIKDASKRLGIEIKEQTKRLEKGITDELDTIIKGQGNDRYIKYLEDRLEQIQQNKLKGNNTRCTHKTRTNIDSDLYDEVRQIESSIHDDRKIKQITDMDGKNTTDQTEITNAFKQYYTKLYSHENIDINIQNKYAKQTKQLTDEQKLELDLDITSRDIENTINAMNLGKSPGPDGLTVEFYKFFLPELKDSILKVIKHIHESGELTPSQNMSYITLIKKTNKNSKHMKDYRPISLLNTDYKIITKTLAEKIKKFLPELIHPDQTCAIKDRYIEQNTHLIRDIIGYTNNIQSKTYILSIDQEKAFDRLAHSYIHNTLKIANIGNYFRNWVKILYKNPESSVIVNQNLSESFKIGRSVRQGCPLSAILYTLCLENLLESVRKDPSIRGTQLPGNHVKKLVAYADDTTFFPKDITSMEKIVDKFKEFGKGSGAKINVEKSKIMKIGSDVHTQEDKTNLDLEWVEEIKILGIVYKKTNKPNKKLWNRLLHITRQKIQKFAHMKTTIYERAKITNTYLIPKFLYTLKIFDPPHAIIQTVKKTIAKYIIGHRSKNISYQTLTLPTHLGGLGLHDIQHQLHTARIRYINTALANPEQHPLAIYYLGTRVNKFKKMNHTVPHFGGLEPPTFYKLCGRVILENENLIGKDLESKEIYLGLSTKNTSHVEQDFGLPSKYIQIATKNLYNFNVSKKGKDLTYKMFYDILPTSNNTTCKLCNKDTRNGLQHILLHCNTTQPIVTNTIDTIQKTTQYKIHDQLALQHNIIPSTEHDSHTANLKLLEITRQSIWTGYTQKYYDGSPMDTDRLKAIYNCLVDDNRQEILAPPTPSQPSQYNPP